MESIDQINIEADSDWLYTNLAALFDNPSFMEDVRLARDGLGLKELVPFEQLSNWSSKEFAKHADENKAEHLGGDKNHPFFHLSPTKTETISDMLCKKYGKPPLYDQSIREAILCGGTKVSGKTTAYPRIIYPQEKLEDVELAIIITPETRLKEIENVLKDESFYRLVEEYKTAVLKNFVEHDTRPNIRRDREWYWLHKAGKTNPEIKEMYEPTIDIQGIFNAIKSYKELIDTHLPAS